MNVQARLIITHALCGLAGAGAFWVLSSRQVPLPLGPSPLPNADVPAVSAVSSSAQAPRLVSPSPVLLPPGAEATREVLQTANGVNRRSAFQQLLNRIRTFEDAKTCYDALLAEEAQGRLFPDLKTALLERAGAVAGARFAELFLPRDRNAIPDPSLGPVIRGWAGIDAVGAVNWVNAAKGSFKILLSTALIEGSGTVNPDYARSTFKALPSAAQGAAISAMLDLEAARGGLTALKTWSEQFLRDIAAKAEPPHIQAALTNETFEKVAARVVRGDRTEALAWLSQQWENDQIATGLQNKTPEYAKTLTRSWVEEDPDSMGNWLNQNKNSIAYDRLTQQFAAHIATADYDAAAAWVETIGNPEIQSQTRKEIEFKKVFASLGNAPSIQRPSR